MAIHPGEKSVRKKGTLRYWLLFLFLLALLLSAVFLAIRELALKGAPMRAVRTDAPELVFRQVPPPPELSAPEEPLDLPPPAEAAEAEEAAEDAEADEADEAAADEAAEVSDPPDLPLPYPAEPVLPPVAPSRPAVSAPMPPPVQAQGNTVGMPVREESSRPSAVGIAVHPSRSAVTQTDTAPLDRSRTGAPGSVSGGEDAVVTADFVRDLAEFLAANYWPRGSHVAAMDRENSTASLSAVNQRYGMALTSFTSTRAREGRRDFYRDRRLLLNYVFNPYMLPALTRMYADQLAGCLVESAGGQIRNAGGREIRLGDEEIISMLRYYARYARAAGRVLLAYAESGSAHERIRVLRQAEEAGFEANARMLEASYRQDVALAQGERENIRLAAEAVSQAGEEYRLAVLALREAREQVALSVAGGQEGFLDNDSLVYIANWAARRGPRGGQSLQAASASMDYLSRVLLQKADDLAGKRGASGRGVSR
ncbi:MAG: hypothetical protein FWF99_00735 [Desulfovibrionaceae bacterium]|nr:hypothetical protein [Desulfovibrionaceae bacterium]